MSFIYYYVMCNIFLSGIYLNISKVNWPDHTVYFAIIENLCEILFCIISL